MMEPGGLAVIARAAEGIRGKLGESGCEFETCRDVRKKRPPASGAGETTDFTPKNRDLFYLSFGQLSAEAEKELSSAGGTARTTISRAGQPSREVIEKKWVGFEIGA
jgi:hypothetical protein